MDVSPFFGTGQTLASLYCVGNVPDRKDWLKREQKGVESSLDSSRNIRLLRPFGPDALPKAKDFKADSTSSLVNTILSKCELSLLISGRSGRMAFCSFRTVWLWKKVFKIFALSHSSVYILLFTSKGGTDEFVIGIMKDLSVDHQSLEESVVELSLFAILS